MLKDDPICYSKSKVISFTQGDRLIDGIEQHCLISGSAIIQGENRQHRARYK